MNYIVLIIIIIIGLIVFFYKKTKDKQPHTYPTDVFGDIKTENKDNFIKVPAAPYFENKGMLSYIPKHVFREYLSSGKKYFEMTEEMLYDIEQKYQADQERDRILNNITKFNNSGIQFEKLGMIEKAISTYEKCTKYMIENYGKGWGDGIAWHSPNRLRILYKKEKHPREIDFLTEFTNFCKLKNIEYPEIYERRLNQLKNSNL